MIQKRRTMLSALHADVAVLRKKTEQTLQVSFSSIVFSLVFFLLCLVVVIEETLLYIHMMMQKQ